MCPLGRAGSSPALGTLSAYLSFTRVAKLVDAQSSGGCAFGRAGSSPAPGTKREIAAMRSPVFGLSIRIERLLIRYAPNVNTCAIRRNRNALQNAHKN